MRENLTDGSVNDIIDQVTQLEVATHKQQRIPILNITIVMTALASLMAISITKKAMNKGNNAMFIFLFLVIGISLLSLSVSAIMINTQASSGSTTSGGSSSGSGIGDTQMGICVVGAGGPCNGDKNLDR
jgi:hypothetical protein